MRDYAKIARGLKNSMNDFIETYQGNDCFNMHTFIEHCQNEMDSLEGGRIHAIMLMQINGWDGSNKFKGMQLLG